MILLGEVEHDCHHLQHRLDRKNDPIVCGRVEGAFYRSPFMLKLWFSLFKAIRWPDISLNVFHNLISCISFSIKQYFPGINVRRRRLFKAKSRLMYDKAIFSNCLEVDHPMCRAGLLQRALSAECSANDKWGSRSPPPPPPPPRPMNE